MVHHNSQLLPPVDSLELSIRNYNPTEGIIINFFIIYQKPTWMDEGIELGLNMRH